MECVREGAEEILKGGKMKRKDKGVDRTDRLERGILFRRNENNNARIGILPGRRLGP